VSALLLGLGFMLGTIDLGRNPTPARSMRLFAFSISYVTVLFGAMAADVLIRHGV
jgi:protoheme IX farnesyltransferase